MYSIINFVSDISGASLIGGIIGSVMTLVFYYWFSNRERKIDTLRRFMGHKSNCDRTQFNVALNEIPVTFANASKVLDAFKKVLVQSQQNTIRDEDLIELIESMAKNIHINMGISKNQLLRFVTLPDRKPNPPM
ncbi:DUF6680 family protein [Candidatus Spongiihabitans sp.]|uniref:DUF6680 family protein n=1 Tax=Candidatus Spongiihabitans sp. TaxID=3101308 RepID=UPI003C6F31B5